MNRNDTFCPNISFCIYIVDNWFREKNDGFITFIEHTTTRTKVL